MTLKNSPRCQEIIAEFAAVRFRDWRDAPVPLPNVRYPCADPLTRAVNWEIQRWFNASSGELPPGRAERMPRVNLLGGARW